MAKKPRTRAERLASALRENLKRRKGAQRATRAADDKDARPVPERPNPAPKAD